MEKLQEIAEKLKAIKEALNKSQEAPAQEVVEKSEMNSLDFEIVAKSLEDAGHINEAHAVSIIRKKSNWSNYAMQLIKNVQVSMRKYSDINKLNILLYPKNLLAEHIAEIKKDDTGVIWL